MKLLKAPSAKKPKLINYLSTLFFAFFMFMVWASVPTEHALQIGATIGIGYVIMAFTVKMPSGILSINNCVAVCSCSSVVGNTAVGCNFLMAVEKNGWIMNMVANDGTPNYIDLTATLNDAYFSALINNADKSKRLYPFPEMKNIEDMRDKAITEDFKDGTKYFARLGLRGFTGLFPPDSASPQMDGVINQLRCNKTLGRYSIDANGTIWGVLSADGTKLYPAKIDPQSVYSTFIKPTDETVQKQQMIFNYHPSMQDCTLAGIPSSSLIGGVDPLSYTGLYNIYLIPISCDHTAGTIVFNLNDGWGNAVTPEAVTGFLKTNFSVYDKTTPGALVINTSTENANIPGQYSLLMTTSFLAADQIVVTPAKTGFDGSPAAQVIFVAT